MTKTPGRFSSRIALVALALATALPVQLVAAQSCQGDVVANGIVNGADLGTLLSYWGPRTADPFSVASDIDGDGQVGGGDIGLLLSGWGYCPATISSVSPSQGCLLGGTQVTITGQQLSFVHSVRVGGRPCSGVTVLSSTTVLATVPVGTSGSADVAVDGLGGTVNANQAFTYLDMTVSMISPNTGTTTGGTSVLISGACLRSVTSILIGGAEATGVAVAGTTEVSAVTPPGAVGAADVVVIGEKGSLLLPAAFTYSGSVIPTAPTSVSASDGTRTDGVVVTWSAVNGATGYRVFRAAGAEAVMIGSEQADTVFLDLTAMAGYVYQYGVKAVSPVGESGMSAFDAGWRNVVPPSGVNATDGTSTTSVSIVWNAVAAATGYKIFRSIGGVSTEQIGSPSTPVTSFLDTSATPGTLYDYSVKATTAAGDSATSTPNSGWRNLPAPTGVVASDGSSTAYVRIDWNPVPGATGYKISRAIGAGEPTTVAIVNGWTSKTWFDGGADPGVLYTYTLRARSMAGESASSAPDTGFRGPAPP